MAREPRRGAARPDAPPPDRLAAQWRAEYEAHRGDAAPEALPVEERIAELDAPQREALQREAARLAPTSDGRDATPAGGSNVSAAPPPEALRQRASLELKLQTEADRARELAEQLAAARRDHAEAVQALDLQQKRIKELQDERHRLLADVQQLESKLRVQINETEQAAVRYEKLRSSRESVSEQSILATERINALQAEVAQLKGELEQTRQKRDEQVAGVQAVAQRAEANTAEAVFGDLWAAMQKELPEVFTQTHVPTRRTFDQLCDVFVELLRTMNTLELHVLHLLRDLRQVSETSDRLNQFHIMFSKSPRLADALRDLLATGKGRSNFSNLLKAHQVWARAFATGLHKAIIRTPMVLADELNFKRWPLPQAMLLTEEARVGKYFKETAMKTIPDRLGTLLKKQAADMAYEDYDDLIKRR